MIMVLLRQTCVAVIIVSLTVSQVVVTHAGTSAFDLPAPGTMIGISKPYQPPVLVGMTIPVDNPLQFDFLVDRGSASGPDTGEIAEESQRLIKYFLAALTVPPDQLWVNLSPYEKDRIVPEGLGRTEMGRDLLAQDYLLKQLTASLMYPEDELGAAFWERVYQRAQSEFGTTDITVNTFNKIWIVPESADVFVKGRTVFIADARLKVMLEEDYLALSQHTAETPGDESLITGVSSEVIREVLIPEIEREVNEGSTFAVLRQIYHSMILASWYKNNLRESFLGRVYVDKARTGGVESADRDVNRKIYDQYVTALEEGVYNYIKEEYDPALDEMIPKKYFSGGVDQAKLAESVREVEAGQTLLDRLAQRQVVQVSAGMTGVGSEGHIVSYRRGRRDLALFGRRNQEPGRPLLEIFRERATSLGTIIRSYRADAGEVVNRFFSQLPGVLYRNAENFMPLFVFGYLLIGLGWGGSAALVGGLSQDADALMASLGSSALGYWTGGILTYKLLETGYVSIRDLIRFTQNMYRQRAIDGLTAEKLPQYRSRFGQTDAQPVNVAGLIGPAAQGFTADYINGNYRDRIYRGDYRRDREEALQDLRVPLSQRPSRQTRETLDRLTSGLPETGPVYSPLLSWTQPVVPGMGVGLTSAGGKATLNGDLIGSLRITIDHAGDEHYGTSDQSWPLHRYFEPFFNVPRSGLVINSYDGSVRRTLKILTDVTLPRRDLLDAEDLDIIEMLPLNDPVRSMISGALLNVFYDVPEKAVEPYIEGESRPDLSGFGNQMRRSDGSTYVFGFESSVSDEGAPPVPYNMSSIGTSPRNAIVTRRALRNIFITIAGISDNQQRQAAIEYLAETLFFMARLFELRYPQTDDRFRDIGRSEKAYYSQMLAFPYYVFDLLVNQEVLNDKPSASWAEELKALLESPSSRDRVNLDADAAGELLDAFREKFAALHAEQGDFILSELTEFGRRYDDPQVNPQADARGRRYTGPVNWTTTGGEAAVGFIRSLDRSISDRARLVRTDSADSTTPVGGIDLNPLNLTVNISGDVMQVSIPPEFIELQNVPVEGFVPVIINMTPVTNLPLLLGLTEPESAIQVTRGTSAEVARPVSELDLLSFRNQGAAP